jgi:hypothetical protein
MKKQNKKLILIFFSIIIYTIVYKLFTLDNEQDYLSKTKMVEIERPDYLEILIQADAKTEINEHTPVQITNKDKNISIKNVFIIKNYQDEFSDNKKYLVDVPKEHIQTLLKIKNLEIHHNKISFKTKKRGSSYEINY